MATRSKIYVMVERLACTWARNPGGIRTIDVFVELRAGPSVRRDSDLHALDDIRDDFHRIVYASTHDAARAAYATFERTWGKRCPGVVTSLREGGDELLTCFRFPKAQWKTLRTTRLRGSTQNSAGA